MRKASTSTRELVAAPLPMPLISTTTSGGTKEEARLACAMAGLPFAVCEELLR
jgi:hypothetical protein